MPEGDTIRRLADRISRRFVGEQCVRCVTRDPRLVGVDLAGATLVDVDAVDVVDVAADAGSLRFRDRPAGEHVVDGHS